LVPNFRVPENGFRLKFAKAFGRKLDPLRVPGSVKTRDSSEGARSGRREPRKTMNFGFADPNNRHGG